MSQPRRYQFSERLEMSQGVSAGMDVADILTSAIPGALRVFPAHKQNDRQGTDWWVECESGGGRFLSVDVKVRSEDWAAKSASTDDLALEDFSVVEKQIVGWTRDPSKRTDYVMWYWQDTGRWCLIPFPFLCRVFTERRDDWRSQYQTARQFTPRALGGYHSECVFVPRKVVWRAIYETFGGKPAPIH